MGNYQHMFFCKNCDKSTLHITERPNHVLHVILSIISVGIWIPVWFILSFFSRMNNVGDCTVCGGLSNELPKPSKGSHSFGYSLGKLFRKKSK